MADNPQDRKALMRQFKKTLVKPLEAIGLDVGELQAAVVDGLRTDLDIAAATIDAMSMLVRKHIEDQLSDVENTLRIVAQQVHMHAASELGAVGELLDSVPYSREVADQPNAEGWRHGSDERSPDERAADPLSSGANPFCPPTKSTGGTTPPPVSQPPKTAEPPKQTQPPPTESKPPTDSGRDTQTEPGSAELGDCSVNYWRNRLNDIKNQVNVAAVKDALETKSTIAEAISDMLTPFQALLGPLLKDGSLDQLKEYLAKQLTPAQQKSNSTIQCYSALSDADSLLYLGTRAASLFFGGLMDPLKHTLEYSLKGRCPYIYPGTDGALSAYLADAIDINTARSWAEIQGECWEPVLKLLESRRSKPVPPELVRMRRRSVISESDFFASMRRLGYTDKQDVANIYKITEELPPVSEIIRYMVRDVADEQVVQHFNFDALYDQKFKGFLKTWAEQQGIPDDYTKAAWRAHWILPGPGQLYEMYQRLRKLPESDPRHTSLSDVEQALRHNDVLPFWIPKLLAVSFRPLGRIDIRRAYNAGAMSIADVELAYSQLGYDDENAHKLTVFTDTLRNQSIYNTPPIRQWRQELINRNTAAQQLLDLKYDAAIVAQSLDVAAKMQRNNTAVKLFGQQKITRQEAEQRLTQHGITPADYNSWLDTAALNYRNSQAVKLFGRDVITRAEAEQRLKTSGIADDMIKQWLDDTAANRATNDAVAEYQKGLISNQQARTQMTADGLPAERIDQLLNKADDKRQAETNGVCATALVKRYVHGEFNAGDLQTKLVGVGIAPDFAEELVIRANCQQSAIGKDPTTAQLCEWLDLGLMTPAQFVERLERIGWQHDEAINILVQCQTKHGAARAKAAAAEAKAESAALAKAKAVEKRAATAVAKDIADRQRRIDKAAAARTKRESLMLDAADKLRGPLQLTLQESAQLIRTEKQRIQDAYALSVDDAIAAVVKAVEDWQPDQNTAFSDSVDDAAMALVALHDSLDSPSVNGFSS